MTTGDDCCTDWHSTSMQAQVYSIIKDLDPYHATIGASDCANSWMFRDVATMIPPTVRRYPPSPGCWCRKAQGQWPTQIGFSR